MGTGQAYLCTVTGFRLPYFPMLLQRHTWRTHPPKLAVFEGHGIMALGLLVLTADTPGRSSGVWSKPRPL